MTSKGFIKLLICLGITGCSSQPKVYLYAKYLHDNQTHVLQQQLEASNYDVEINHLDFPTSIDRSTILYSLFLKDPAAISLAEHVATEAGMPIDRTQGLTEGNHWYTKNSLAMFLLPNNPAGNSPVFKEDLVKTFIGENCGAGISVSLHQDGTYTFSDQSIKLFEKELVTGTWEYRQYSYLELKRHGAQFSDFYFEISRSLDEDNVSKIEFVKLTALSLQHFPENCVFRNGLRL